MSRSKRLVGWRHRNLEFKVLIFIIKSQFIFVRGAIWVFIFICYRLMTATGFLRS